MRITLPLITILFSLLLTTAHGQNSPYDSILRHAGDIQLTLPDSALSILADIKPKAQAEDDQFALMKIITFEGLDHYYKSEYDLASEKYFEALELAEHNNFRLHKGILCNNLGSLYFDMKQYKKAQAFYDSAYVIMTEKHNVKWLSKITGNYAGVYFMQGDMDGAIALLEESIDYGLEAASFVSVAGAYGNLAMVLTQLNRKEEALAIFDKGLTMLDSVGDKRGVCIVKQKLGALLADMNENEKAAAVLYSTLALAHEIKHHESVMNSHLTLANYFEKTGQKDSSLAHLKLHIQWKDSVYDEKSFETISELEQKYQSAKKEANIERLENEKQQEIAKTEAKELENWILWLGIGISLITLGFILIQLINKRKSNQLLSEKNSIIEDSLAEKEVLMREVHHRVKNNFQLVSGVLMISASKADNEKAKQALLEVRSRIQSMATTHQKLYQSDTLSEIQLKPFLNDLIDEVEMSYGEENVTLAVEIDETVVSVDRAITIGLVVTEAMINAYKYAFKQGGNLSIRATQTDALTLSIKDDGPGFDTAAMTDSFGVLMVKNLIQKAQGTVAWTISNGTEVLINLPKA
jgi:two-component sensor histidine kinase